MRDTLTFILVVGMIIGWALFFNERESRPSIVGTKKDSIVYVHDTIRPKQPKPVMTSGTPDTVIVVDSVLIDFLRSELQQSKDTIAFWQNIIRTFRLQYEDSIQKMTVGIDPIRRTGLFSPFYKDIPYLKKETYQTSYVESEKWFKLFVGGEYIHREINRSNVFINADIKLRDDLYLMPGISTDRFNVMVRLKVY